MLENKRDISKGGTVAGSETIAAEMNSLVVACSATQTQNVKHESPHDSQSVWVCIEFDGGQVGGYGSHELLASVVKEANLVVIIRVIHLAVGVRNIT